MIRSVQKVQHDRASLWERAGEIISMDVAEASDVVMATAAGLGDGISCWS